MTVITGAVQSFFESMGEFSDFFEFIPGLLIARAGFSALCLELGRRRSRNPWGTRPARETLD